ncbi:hypothetical protein [Profundibacterium mesophilum]|uniref:Uncharacterized protein n=1 Tax=Profundibacterium mesophilum KAUST100406-0324 TaxID=1037889 RepID=A0A921NSY0_9RHOB|nr:hypothetical protein [Profundibacterium mesophilum]KAF0674883.1 hypothetical protein PMES_02765 [Profundibacterium mesophilum KAUST100406-0324]
MNWDHALKEEVNTPTGRKWVENAGDWANEKIEAFNLNEVLPFVVEWSEEEGAIIDPRNIVGTDHARYNQGMTWLQFLGGGKRIKTKLDVLESKPEYYDDPELHATDLERWILFEIDGKLYVTVGNHRSVVAKFRAHEENITAQWVHKVIHLKVSGAARNAYETLQTQYLPFERDFGPEPECVWCEGPDKRFKIRVHLILHGLGGSRSHGKMEVATALAYVKQRNRVPRRFLDFFPNLWKRIYS